MVPKVRVPNALNLWNPPSLNPWNSRNLNLWNPGTSGTLEPAGERSELVFLRYP